MGSRLTQLGVILFVVGILLLAFLLNRVVKRIRYRDTGKLTDSPPKRASLSLMMVAVVLIVIAQGFFWLSSQIQYFRPLLSDGSIGTVEVLRVDDPVKSLRIRYVPAASGIANEFFLSGDSWRFSGEIIGFKFANSYFQLPSRCYKTTQFDSRYLERLPPNTSGALLHQKILEGGSSGAYALFRDSRVFGWFARVDSFATDFVTADKQASYNIKIQPDRTVDLVQAGQ